VTRKIKAAKPNTGQCLAITLVSESPFHLNSLNDGIGAPALTGSLSRLNKIKKKTPPGEELKLKHRESFCLIHLIIAYIIPTEVFHFCALTDEYVLSVCILFSIFSILL